MLSNPLLTIIIVTTDIVNMIFNNAVVLISVTLEIDLASRKKQFL